MKEIAYIVAPLSIPEPLLKKVRARARKLYGKRKFSHHVCRVLEKDLQPAPQPEPAQ